MSFFDSCAEVARRQHGLVTLGQARAAGLSLQQVRTLVAKGVLVREGRGVLRVAGTPSTWEQRVNSAVLCSGDAALAGARSAAALWSLHRYRRGPIDVLTPRWSRRRHGDWTVHETLDLASRDRTVMSGIPVTTPTRTLIDVARHVSVQRLGSMVDDAVSRDLTSYEALHLRFSELARRGRDGITAMREVLDARPVGTVAPDSAFEHAVRLELRQTGIDPVVHHRVAAGEVSYVLDISWPDFLVAVECDGFRFHRTEEQLEWDTRRRNALTLRGWIVLHETYQRHRQQPSLIRREAIDALRLRGADL